MFRRILLWVLMNIMIIVMIQIIFAILTFFFPELANATNGYLGLAIMAAVIGFMGSFISLSISRWSAKRAYKIQLIDENNIVSQNSKVQLVHQTVAQIANQEGIKMPEVGVYQSKDPNAFATGPGKNSSLVAVSTGLLDTMSEGEIEGVVAHEMAHILNGDMVTMTLLQGVINTFVIFVSHVIARAIQRGDDSRGFSYYIVVWILEIIFGLLGSIVLMKFSRWREFRADAGSASYVGRDKMIKALQRLQSLKQLTAQHADDKMPAFKISQGEVSGFKRLFMSHPPLQERIDALYNNLIN